MMLSPSNMPSTCALKRTPRASARTWIWSGVPMASRMAGTACSSVIVGSDSPASNELVRRPPMLHEPGALRAVFVCMLLLGLAGLAGCHSAHRVKREPMFVGTPVVSSLRPDIVSLQALGAPPPAVRRLQLSVRVTANDKPLGTSSETLGQSAQSYGQYVE